MSRKERDFYEELKTLEARIAHLEACEPRAWAACRVYNSIALPIPNAAVTALTFDSERFDTHDAHSTALNPGRLTCQIPGIYHIGLALAWDPDVNGRRFAAIRLNGTTEIADVECEQEAAGRWMAAFGTDYQLAVGDYVEAIVYQSSGGPLNIQAALNYSPEFSMVLVGFY